MKKIIILFMFITILFISCDLWTDGWSIKYSASGTGVADVEYDGITKTINLPWEKIVYHSEGESFYLMANTDIKVHFRFADNHIWERWGSSEGSKIVGKVRR